MEISILEIMNELKFETPEDFLNLVLEPKFQINKKHLLSLALKQITLEIAIFKDDPNSKFIFTKETLLLIVEEKFFSKTFSKKDHLNIFANQNGNLLWDILDLKVFDKIYIINDIQDYEPEALNIRQGSDLSFEVLQNKMIKEEIFIKYLINREGQINIKYLDHLQNCMFFMNTKTTKVNFDHSEFALNLNKSNLQKITNKFNLKKFLYYIYHQYDPFLLNQNQIENLIVLNGDFIDSKIFVLILNNYHKYKDENQNWLKTNFKSYDFCFTNYDIVEWISSNPNNPNIYQEYYSKIEEFHNYTFHDQKVYQIFCSCNFFIEEMVEYSHLVNFLMQKLSHPIDVGKDHEKIISEMIKFLIKNRSHSFFQFVASNPEKILFKIKEYNFKKYMEEDFLSENFEIILKFHNHDIRTNLKELSEAIHWDDLYDFNQKLEHKEIKIDEVLSLNLNSITEVLKSFGVSKGLVECCICFGIAKKDTYIFKNCSHFICKECILNYLTSEGLSIKKQEERGNCLEIFLTSHVRISCPKCKGQNPYLESIVFLKIYI